MYALAARARFLFALFALMLAAGSVGANDLIGDTEVYSKIFRNVDDDGKDFARSIRFDLGEPGSFVAQLMSFGLEDVSLSLVDRTRHIRTQFDDVASPYFSTGLLSLLPGQYRLVLDGEATVSGAFYSLAISAQPVPEPGHWALLLSGLLMIGMMSARRTR